MTKVNHPLRVGLFGIGLDTYWPQFAGLKTRLERYLGVVAERLQRPGVEVVSLGLIDSPPKALEAGHQFRAADVDLIFLHVTTYALSSTVLPVVQRARVPVIVLNLQPAAAIDYANFNQMGDRTAMTGEWLAYCAACPVPEIANVFNRAGVDFHQITGMLHDDQAYRKIHDLLAKTDGMIAELDSGKGTAGQLLQDRRLYDSLNKTLQSISALMADVRTNPQKYLRLKAR